MKVGIIGAGGIAGTMARTLAQMDGMERYAIASRDAEKAKAFAERFGFAKAYGSYEEMVRDPEVELVYVATPHSHHYEHAKLSLEHGKHVLCEKAFTVNEAQAAELCALAGEKGLLLAEAIWPRYMPMGRTLKEVLESGIVGKPCMLTANLSYQISHVERIWRPELAGGALLDLGVYTLTFASMAFGDDIKEISGHVVLGETGVDLQHSITLTYRDGRMAVLTSSAMGLSDRRGVIYCEKGYVEVENINNPEEIRVYDAGRRMIASYLPPADQINGYEYEVEACAEAIREGWSECPAMPHAETLRIMGWMDELRRQWGIVYPMESDTAGETLKRSKRF